MLRVLDIDLDFFVSPVVYLPQGKGRPADDEYSVWPVDDALGFLADRCGLNGRLPGFVTERHHELFPLWRESIEGGLLQPPFHVTHVDAHADLGMGDASWKYILTELLFQPLEARKFPREGGLSGLAEGNYLSFAIACQWLGELIYVHGYGAGSDVPKSSMQDFRMDAPNIQLPALTEADAQKMLHFKWDDIDASRLEPPVSFQRVLFTDFEATDPYDLVCITRSPQYAPPKADVVYDRIIENFIEPISPR